VVADRPEAVRADAAGAAGLVGGPEDWVNPGVNAIVTTIMRNTRSGSIILEHDGGRHRSETVAALKIVLPRLLAAGFRFRTA
jgi:peptidoglycan/xylan/chitin deacetylase (PgdA/CDA1 family)